MREIFLQNLEILCESNDAFLLVSDQWYTERRVRMTASDCLAVVSLQSSGAISNFLTRNLWKTERFTTLSLRHGLKNEVVASKTFESLKWDTIKSTETGLWVSNSDSKLACSPDGIVVDSADPDRYELLEIRRIRVRRTYHSHSADVVPSSFTEITRELF